MVLCGTVLAIRTVRPTAITHISIAHIPIAMALSDRLLGGLLLSISTFVFSYYTLWALITPLFPSDSSLQQLFPPRIWVIRLPALILVAGLGVVGLFVGSVMRKEAKKQREKQARRAA